MTLPYLIAYALILLTVGYFLPDMSNRPLARWLAWFIAIVTVVYSVVITEHASAVYRMVAIVSLQLLSMKAIVAVETYATGNKLSFVQWCAFVLGWFGMRPALFEALPSSPLPQGGLLFKGLSRILLGLILLYASAWMDARPEKVYFVPDLLLLIGLSLVLHFGILNLSTAGWRIMGVDVRELFRAPYRARSLKEFWGKRWNIAFSEMTALIAYRPLKHLASPNTAMLVSFLLSGLLHEIAISLPVRAGYGLPFLYFMIHGTLMYAESRSAAIQRITTHPFWSHVWVLGWLVVPMPLLFHAQFIAQVLKPLRNLILTM